MRSLQQRLVEMAEKQFSDFWFSGGAKSALGRAKGRLLEKNMKDLYFEDQELGACDRLTGD